MGYLPKHPLDVEKEGVCIMKRFVIPFLAGLLLFCAAGCASQDAQEDQIANPVREVTQAEQYSAAGVSLAVPAEATDAVFSVIELPNDEHPIAQVDFALDGQQYCFRGQVADQMDVSDATEAVDISGMEYEWTSTKSCQIGECTATVYLSDEGTGYIAWVDPNSELIFNVSMSENASDSALEQIANTLASMMEGAGASDSSESA